MHGRLSVVEHGLKDIYSFYTVVLFWRVSGLHTMHYHHRMRCYATPLLLLYMEDGVMESQIMCFDL
jgi:hypothetical protein